MKTLIFDWGDTIMRDFFLEGPMWKWKKVEWIANAEKDIEGAKAAEIKTIFFNENQLHGNFVKADLEIYSMENLKVAVEQLF